MGYKEFIMTTLVSPIKKRLLKYFNPCPLNCLPIDKGQSGLLQEPKSRISISGPMSGEGISEVLAHHRLEQVNLPFYLQSDQTRKDHINMPLNEPDLKLKFKPSVQVKVAVSKKLNTLIQAFKVY